MSNAFIYRTPGGIPGDVTRREAAIIEPQQYDTDYPCLYFGIPVKLSSGKIRPMAAGDTDQPYGFLVRPYPSQMTASEALGVSTPDISKIADVMVRGYMTVLNLDGTPAKNGTVYYRTQAGSPASYVGRITAENDGSPTVCTAITNCRFMGDADSDGNVEIAFKM